MNELVSIIIPAFNRAHLISETLDSVLYQTYANWECIVVDDGSADNTKGVVEKYLKKDSRFQYHIRPKRHKSGANGARNYGFTLSKGKFIQWLDSDDLLKESCLEGRMAFLSKEKELDFAVFSMGLYKGGIKTVDVNREIVNKEIKDTIRQFLCGKKLPWNVCRPFFRRETIENIRFNEELLSFQDDEFNIRVLKSKLNIKYESVDVTDCYYRIDKDPYKLTSKESFLKIFPSLFEFYKSIFSILDTNELEEFKVGLINRFYEFVKYYHKLKNNNTIVIETLNLFDRQYSLGFQTKLKFWSIIYVNSFWFDKKGHYKLTKLIDRL